MPHPPHFRPNDRIVDRIEVGAASEDVESDGRAGEPIPPPGQCFVDDMAQKQCAAAAGCKTTRRDNPFKRRDHLIPCWHRFVVSIIPK
jgi:hypothetical protein